MSVLGIKVGAFWPVRAQNIVAPRLKPIEEVIGDGREGLLYNAKSRKGLAESIIKLLTDEKLFKKTGCNAQEKVLSNYTWKKNAEMILFRYKEIVKKKEEVRFVLQYFYPEVASTAQLMTELAEGLVEKGLLIKAFTGQPTYVRSKKLARKERYKGIDIERLPCARFEKNSFLGRMLNWTSYTMLVFFRLLFSKDRSPIFIVSTPPFLFVVGYLLKILRGQHYTCLVYDLYPDIAERLGYIKKDSFISRVWNRCNKEFFKNADCVIVPSENMKRLIKSKINPRPVRKIGTVPFGDSPYFPSNDGKVKVICNWADGETIRPMRKKDNWFAKKHGLVDKLVVLYAGNIGLFHQLETIIEAADMLRTNKEIKFVFIGEGGKKKKLMDMTSEKGLDNVLFLPYQNKEILPYSLTCSDISVVSLEKSLDCVAAPCKLYSSLAAGQIILGLVDRTSDVAKVVESYTCGFCAAQDDTDKAVKIIDMLYNDPELQKRLKENARECFESNFRRDKAINKYYEVFSGGKKEEIKYKKGGLKWELVHN